MIAKGSKGSRLYDWFSDIQLVKNVSKENINHPCSVPVELMERIILLTTNEGDTVLDPFMGSGTTAIAAYNLGRLALGMDLSEEYRDLAVERFKSKGKFFIP